jgi:hypothetical protein
VFLSKIRGIPWERTFRQMYSTWLSPYFAIHNFIFRPINPLIAQIIINNPPARKRSSAFFCRSPNKKKFGASDDTNKKYPPVAIKLKAMSKVNVLNINAINRTQPKTCKLLLPNIIKNYEFQLTVQ